MKRLFYLFILLSTFIFSANILFAQRDYYKAQSGFDIGLGLGASYQKSDIRNSLGGAGTVFIGHSIYQQPGAFFGFDWRVRFLGGRNKAFDDRITIDSYYNNIRYTHYNYDLEFELTLNRLRERTGIVLSGFGGAGVTKNITAKNLLNASDAYDYSTINSGGDDDRFKIYRDLRKLSDKSFETAEMNKFCLSPTLGFYIGYQITPHFTMGIEHKVNYFLDEVKANIDGVPVAVSKMDRNRYTALSLRWHIPHESVNPFAPCEKPVVNFSVIKATQGKYSHQLSGTVLNVQSQSNISISVDGNPDQYFTYVPGANSISSGYTLSPGSHIFKITASTKCGSDTKTVQVIVEEPCISPVVRLSLYEPTSDGGTYRIEGQISNINNQDQIFITVDGANSTNFTFDNRTKKYISTHQLGKGSHSVTVSVKNECGQDQQSFQFNSTEPCSAPLINFSVSENNYNNNTHELVGKVENVTSVSDIVVTVDGKQNDNFKFVPGTKQISAMFTFKSGTHTIVVSAKNECGQDTESVKVTVGAPCTPPALKIAVNETTSNNFTHEISGTVTNIEKASDITINVDGVRDDNFRFISSTGRISSMYKFGAGKHLIVVTVKNACGQKSEEIEVTVKSPCEKPIVKVSVSAGKTDGTFTHTMSGTVINVKSKNEITVKVDGVVDNSFTYTPSTSQLSGRFKLSAGSHKISVTAKNECGEDTQTVEVTEKAPCTPPIVKVSVSAGKTYGVFTHTMSGTVINVKSKNEITVKVDGVVDNSFTYTPSTYQLSGRFKLSVGSHKISVTAKNECGEDTQTVEVTEKAPCTPPIVKVSVSAGKTDGVFTHTMSGTVINVKSKNEITVKVDGVVDNSFTYTPSTYQLSGRFKLSVGSHKISVTAKNECGEDTQTVEVTIKSPCEKPIVKVSVSAGKTDGVFTHTMSGTVINVKSKNEITVKVDGVVDNSFTYNSSNSQISGKFKLSVGVHKISVTAKNECGEDTQTVEVTIKSPCEKPIVKVSVSAGKTDGVFTHTMSGTVINVKSKNEITVKVDGVVDNSFTYNSSNSQIGGKFKLSVGVHKISVTAKNECGEDTQTVEVTIKAPCVKPAVKVSVSEKADGSYTHTMSGTVTNVKNKSEITVKVDGVVDNSFTYNSSNSQISGKFKLSVGGHKISVTAKNECGEDTQTVEVTLKAPCVKPIVKVSVREKADGSYTHFMSGTVINVKSKNEITVKVDGVVDNSFTYNSSTSQLSGKFKLSVGGHKISVTAKNECGEASQTVEVTIKAPCVKPAVKVSVSEKADGSYTHTMSGTVTNVKNKSEITVKVDGVVDNSFTYTPSTSQLSGKYKLSVGSHKISVTAKNECGEDTQTVEVTVKAPCVKPAVKVSVREKADGSYTHTMSGTVTNVKNKSEITVKVDGVVDNSFTYTPSTSQLSGKYKLSVGSHKISVTAKNECGEDTQNLEVILKAPCVKPAVKVSVRERSDGSYTHTMSGTVTNVKNKNEITVKVDGVVDNSFTYSSSTSQLSGKFKLSVGSHKISVTAKNECGEASQTVEITVKAPCVKPAVKVSVREKADGSYTHTMSGTVTNVKNKSEITVKVDGVVDNSFTYTPSTSQLSGKYKLSVGSHRISVTAKNECGEDTQNLEVILKAPCVKPLVKISVSESQDKEFTHILNGTVKEVKSKSEITLKIDGVVNNSFTYNSNTLELNSGLNLSDGSHKITVSAKNECGDFSQEVEVIVKGAKGKAPVKINNNTNQPIKRN